jgi:AcrR family transcriptional regulator
VKEAEHAGGKGVTAGKLTYLWYFRTVSITTLPRTRRTRAESRADNRRALLDAAAELIVEVGYTAAGLDDIAERAGLTKGAIYSIFGNKLALVQALAADHADANLNLPGLDGHDPAIPVEDVLGELARDYLRLVLRPESLATLAFELEVASLALRDEGTLAILQSRERQQTDKLAEMLCGRPRRHGDPLTKKQAALVADLVLGLLGGTAQRAVTVPGTLRDHRELAAALVRLLPET